ncbi:putative ABC transport system permease protein [Methanococcus maripaludis]|uniref:Putative ABC transport system permease protein n=1 Tax=Methanococcus maripaludis TaxID=39152 RepID=A0A7J9NMF3_METMI|nr:ABC transporter permease [Methanococcus maripaludis]MBA2846326.1 putative ABC transport system permease protein [Methanococcus maripaludis]
MKPLKLFNMASKMVKGSKLRSWITILGIVIGIASVIAIISAGDYLSTSVSDQLNDMLSDEITLTASAAQGSDDDEDPELTDMDVLILNGISDIEYVDVRVSTRNEVRFAGGRETATITGVDPAVWSQMTDEELSAGRFLQASDSNAVIISYYTATEAFDREIGINQMITIGNKQFKVVGILEEDETQGFGQMGGMSSNTVYMPYEAVYTLELDDDASYSISEKEEGVYDEIIFTLYEDVNQTTALENIQKKLMMSRHVNEDNMDFTIRSPTVFEGPEQIISMLTTFLSFIAGISLIVGVTGISNTMFTTVLEKTREIGIMKAIGAKNKDIMLLFVFNSAIIGLVGGFLGLVLGTILSQIIVWFIASSMDSSYQFVLSIKSVVIAIGCSLAAGIIAGIIPAYNASKLKPVEALRSE